VPPDDAAAHIHAGTDELDSADSGDLDRRDWRKEPNAVISFFKFQC
jgi:hypothetical protein